MLRACLGPVPVHVVPVVPVVPVVVVLVVVVLVAASAGCGPARAPVDDAAPALVAALAGDHAADVVDVDAAVFGFVRGAHVVFRSGVDGNHDIVRADVEVDGVPGRLFAKLNADHTGLALVAVLPEPAATGEAPRGIARYADAWNVAASRRDAALADGFAVSGDYVDPQVALGDRPALAAHIAAFHDGLADARVDATSGVVTAGHAARFRWVTRGFGLDLIEGEDLVVVDDDGRVALVCGFWDRDPPAL